MIYEEILTMLSLGLKLGSKLPSVQTGNLRAIWSKAKHSQAQDRKERITGIANCIKIVRFYFASVLTELRAQQNKCQSSDLSNPRLSSYPPQDSDDHSIHPAMLPSSKLTQVCSFMALIPHKIFSRCAI